MFHGLKQEQKHHGEDEEDTGIRPVEREIRELKQKEKIIERKKTNGRQQVSTVAFALLPLNSTKTNKAETTTRCRGFRAKVAHAPLISRTGTLPHDLPFRFCIHLHTAV